MENNHLAVSDKDFFNLRREINGPLKVTNELKGSSEAASPTKTINMDLVHKNTGDNNISSQSDMETIN